MQRTKFKVVTILMLIFSFLFTMICFNANNVNAAVSSEVVQDTVELTSTEREGNTITFTTKLPYNVDSITYQIVYYGIDNQKYADLITDGKVEKITDYKYSFYVSDEIIGVKIWKVKYLVSSSNFKNKMTTHNNSVGDVDAIYKKNYVEVLTDKLEILYEEEESFLDSTDTDKIIIFYFNLDTQIDRIEELSLEYSIKTEKKAWWGLEESVLTKSYSVDLDHNQKVVDYETAAAKYLEWYTVNPNATWQESTQVRKDLLNTYKRSVLGANTNDNGYDWYVQPLLDIKLNDKDYIAGSGYYREDLQEVAIVKMSYYSQGEYFEDIPVLDEDTGWIKYEQKSDNDYTLIIVIVGLVLLGILAHLLSPIFVGLKYVVLGIYYAIKYILLGLWFIISLPFRLLGFCFNGDTESKEKKKQEKRAKKLKKNGYNRDNTHYNFH